MASKRHQSITLSKVSSDSNDTVSTAFDIFATPPTHTSVIGGEWEELPPMRPSEGGTLEFYLPGSSHQYVDLNNSYLHVEVKVVKADGSNLQGDVADVLVTPGDNFFHSLFDSATFSIAGKDVEYEPHYAFRAYLEDLLNFGENAKKTHLVASSGWAEDGARARDYAQAPVDDLTKRRRPLVNSGTMSFYGKLHLSMFAQDRYIFPGISCRLRLRRSDPNFCFLATDNAPVGGTRVVITQSQLFVRKVLANPALQKVQTEMIHIEHEEIKLPIDRIKTQFHVISPGVLQSRINLDQNGQRPNRVIVALVDHGAKTGEYKKSPFNFATFDLRSIELLIDGLPVGKKLAPNYTGNNFARTYMNLFTGTGKAGGDTSNNITPTQFANGSAIYAFDTTGDLCADGVHLLTNSSLVLLLGFGTALPATVSVFVYQEINDIITIDEALRVSMIAGAL